ncbi:MAG: VOC family protein [Pseudomonadota bacterium]
MRHGFGIFGGAAFLAAACLAPADKAQAQTDQAETVTMAQQDAPETQREKVLGIGGLFVRSKDPAALSTWYTRHFGINPTPTSYDDEPWVQEEGPTIFAPMPQDVQMIPEGKSWMLNLRVADLDKMVAQLSADGVEVALDPETYPNGRFATLADPEGNAIQLWEPAQ